MHLDGDFDFAETTNHAVFISTWYPGVFGSLGSRNVDAQGDLVWYVKPVRGLRYWASWEAKMGTRRPAPATRQSRFSRG